MNTTVTLARLESDLHEMLGQIVEGVPVPRDTSFFDLGMGSLVIVQLYALIEQYAPGRLTLQEVFDHPSVAALADLLMQRSSVAHEPAATSARVEL